ncbi:MAG: hypothetical protein L0Z62_26100 [Gemmataceae bacterium]|nr:hypothetical protein [Gemmataceae bacterium]
MKTWKPFWLGLALALGLTPQLWAQIPAAPVAPSPAGAALAPPGVAPPAAVPPGAPAPAAPGNIFSLLCPTPEQLMACKIKFCNSILGKIVSAMLRPVSVFSGGLFVDRCAATQIAQDLMKPADSPEGAAARIKADEAAAKMRRLDVRYLGTVDCRYWPEAEEALINALRADRNECVRLEAAWSLNRGCCCTRKTIEALAITVSGSERDGNPPEVSPRVRAAAHEALTNCLTALAEPIHEGPLPAEEPIGPPKERPKDGSVQTPTDYYKRISQLPMKKVAESAHKVVMQVNPAPLAAPARSRPSGVIEVIARAFAPAPRQQPVASDAPTGDLPPPQAPGAALSPPVQSTAYFPTAPAPVPAPQPAPVAQATWTPAPAPPQAKPQTNLPAEVQHLLATLQQGRTHEDRQRAAEALAASSWRAHPDVLSALSSAGRDDPSPAVRSLCLRCVNRINFDRMAP